MAPGYGAGVYSAVAPAFFEPMGEGRWAATSATAGPWHPELMHAGPPSALLARALEHTDPRTGWLFSRLSVDVLGPLPVDVVEVSSRVLRDGRSVSLLEAEMTVRGRVALRATAWRMRTEDLPLPRDGDPGRGDDRHAPETARRLPAEDFPGHVEGYVSAMELRMVSGDVARAGPAVAWMRQQVPLVPDEQPSGLQRVMAVADSGNGISGMLDQRAYSYVNTDLTVHLVREPVGEWVFMDAVTVVDPSGVGLATTRLGDIRGPLGSGAQSLHVARRKASETL